MSKRRYYGDTTANENKGFLACATKMLLSSCVIYTVIVLFIALVISAMNTGEDEGAVFFVDLVFLYPFSLVIAGANMIFANKKLNFWLRLFSHVAIIFAGFALYLTLVKQYEINSLVVLTPVFAVVYAFVMIVVLALRNIKKKQERDNVEYSDVYAKVKSAQNSREK